MERASTGAQSRGPTCGMIRLAPQRSDACRAHAMYGTWVIAYRKGRSADRPATCTTCCIWRAVSCAELYALIRFGLGNTHVCVVKQYETPEASSWRDAGRLDDCRAPRPVCVSSQRVVTIFAGKSLKKNVQTKLSCVKTNVPMGSKALATS